MFYSVLLFPKWPFLSLVISRCAFMVCRFVSLMKVITVLRGVKATPNMALQVQLIPCKVLYLQFIHGAEMYMLYCPFSMVVLSWYSSLPVSSSMRPPAMLLSVLARTEGDSHWQRCPGKQSSAVQPLHQLVWIICSSFIATAWLAIESQVICSHN